MPKAHGFALVGVGLLAVGCATTPRRPEPPGSPLYTDVAEAARYLKMNVSRDAAAGAIVLTDGTNRVVILPGSATAMVNSRPVDLGQSAGYYQGRLVVPVDGLRRIAGHLRPRPAGRR